MILPRIRSAYPLYRRTPEGEIVRGMTWYVEVAGYKPDMPVDDHGYDAWNPFEGMKQKEKVDG